MGLKQNAQYDSIADKIVGIDVESNDKIVFPSTSTVFMVSGLIGKWKQAVGYFFSSKGMTGKNLKEKILTCIDLLHNVGLSVVAVTSDQGSNFSSAITMLNVTEMNHFLPFKREKYLFLVTHRICGKALETACLQTTFIIMTE